MFYNESSVFVLDKKESYASRKTLEEFIIDYFKDNNRYMLKDRYGWSDIISMKCQPLLMSSYRINGIIVDSGQMIPVYNGTYKPGFHGVAVYDHFPMTAEDTFNKYIELKDSDKFKVFLLNASEDKLVDLSIRHSHGSEYFAQMISIETKSGFVDICNLSMHANGC